MQKARKLCFLFIVSSMFLSVNAQNNPFSSLEIITVLQRPPSNAAMQKSAQIEGIRVFGDASGVAFTSDSLFLTENDGEIWREIILPKRLDETISAVNFIDANNGSVILADQKTGSLKLLKTNDGGIYWSALPVEIENDVLQDADLNKITIYSNETDPETMFIILKLSSSSNFEREIRFRSIDGGKGWNAGRSELKPNSFDKHFVTLKYFSGFFSGIDSVKLEGFDSDEESIIVSTAPAHINSDYKHSTWFLTSQGNCFGKKTGCVQKQKIYRNDARQEGGKTIVSLKEITPPEIKTRAEIEKQTAIAEAQNSVFAAPPNGTTRISLNRGFDKCTAATAAQMQTWWDNSPFYDVNIYLSGRNRGCSQAQLSAAWVNAVMAQGWGLIPTVVGYQSPCSVCTSCAKHSSDSATAETQGRGEADIAVADATNLGLTTGSVLYYDMERYDDVSGTGACSTPTKAFLKGWTDRVKELGYISGVYGSPTNAQNDWINIPPASQMDAVWLARWNNVMSVWGVSPLSDAFWTDHQRIHQWLGSRDETWGGVTFNIDNNVSDAPVAALAVAKNKNADFDGDGKSDISVFRPETGVWYVLYSSNSSFSAAQFGLSSDVVAPGDFDGDGKTDKGIFRPSEGNWYLLTKAGMFSSRQFGTSGDIAVPADFNGDGKSDIAVFRPSNGVWYIANSDSRGTFSIVQFGQNGDNPVQADYDGDGKADIAVFRPSTGVWYVLRSSDGNFTAYQFGISTDKIAQGDYDGDGKADYGVFRNGVWYIRQSTGETAIVQFGIAEDVPATGDFDGDGKADIAVFRPSNGNWYLLQSQNGFIAANFGLNGDRPVPSAYLPD